MALPWRHTTPSTRWHWPAGVTHLLCAGSVPDCLWSCQLVVKFFFSCSWVSVHLRKPRSCVGSGCRNWEWHVYLSGWRITRVCKPRCLWGSFHSWQFSRCFLQWCGCLGFKPVPKRFHPNAFLMIVDTSCANEKGVAVRRHTSDTTAMSAAAAAKGKTWRTQLQEKRQSAQVAYNFLFTLCAWWNIFFKMEENNAY